MEVNAFKLAFTMSLVIFTPLIMVAGLMFIHDTSKDTNHEKIYETYDSMKVMEGKIVDTYKPLIGKA